jgi:hypothetical protein
MSDQPQRPKQQASNDIRGWDVRTPDGQLAHTVSALSLALGISEQDARDWVHRHQASRDLPAELIADAGPRT